MVFMPIEIVTEDGRTVTAALEVAMKVGGEVVASGMEEIIEHLVSTGEWRKYSGVCHCGRKYSGAIRISQSDPTACVEHQGA